VKIEQRDMAEKRVKRGEIREATEKKNVEMRHKG